MGTLMKCGHTAQAINRETGEPSCVVCLGFDPGAEQPAEELPDLTGRIARCYYGCTEQPSSVDLAFFRHEPNKERDTFYCGCWGWD